MGTRENIKKTIEEILIDRKWIRPTMHVNEQDDYRVDIGMDSLDFVEVIMDLEKEYGISISDEQVEKLTTIGRTIDYIHQQLNAYESKQN